MRFSPFRRDDTSGVSTRDLSGLLRRAVLTRALDRAGICYSPDNPEGALAALPVRDAPVNLRAAPAQRFESPLPGPAGVTLQTPLFRQLRTRQSGTDLLVLPLNDALELTRHLADSLLALVVITSLADAPLAEHHRELLWRSLGLPVFEQLTAWDGAVIARECEAHDGLHVAADRALLEVAEEELIVTCLTERQSILRARTGLRAELTSSICDCGRETPRIRGLATMPANARAVKVQAA
jgi:hypothetical protein